MGRNYAKRMPRTHSPAVWEQARVDYLNGVSAPEIEVRHGIKPATLHKRAQKEGWTRKAVWREGRSPVGSEPCVSSEQAILDPYDPVDICDAALREAMKALDRGDAHAAAAMIKAADAIGEFADFTRRKKQQAEAARYDELAAHPAEEIV